MIRRLGWTASGRGRGAACAAAVLAASVLLAAPESSAGASGPSSSGGASLFSPPVVGSAPSGGSGLFSASPAKSRIPAPPSPHAKGSWIRGFTVTEYWPTPEAWFIGRAIETPGLPGRHRIDWLYSALGVSMEGEGIGLDGRMYHIDAMGDGGWVTKSGKSTCACNAFAAGPPFWRAGGYWRTRHGAVTFPLAVGGWYAGPSRNYVPLRAVTFAPGASLPLHFLQSIAVDPRVIPLGSRVYIPAYRHDGRGGWFIAQDTGGAINGHRIDIYRRPPASPNIGGQYLTSQRVYVIKAHR